MPPLYICWLITSHCNLSCPHCFAPRCAIELTQQAQLNIISFLRRLSPNLVSLTGGEPCLNKRLPEIASLCSEIAPVRLTTNGLLITPTLLGEISPSLTEVSISLDSVDQSILDMLRPGARVDDILNAIILVKKNGIPLCINTVLSKVNIDHVLKIGNVIFTEFGAYNVSWKLIKLTYNSFVRTQFAQFHQLSNTIFWSTIRKLESTFPSIRLIAFDDKNMNSYCMVLSSEEVVFPGKEKPQLVGMANEIQDRASLVKFCSEHSGVANAMLDVIKVTKES